MEALCAPLPLLPLGQHGVQPPRSLLPPLGAGALGQEETVGLARLAEPLGGTAIEGLVPPHRGPARSAQRPLRDHARCGWRRPKPWHLRAPARLWRTAPWEASQRGVDLHGKDGGFFGTRKRGQRLPTGRTVSRRGAQGLPCRHDKQDRTVPAAMALAARLWPPRARTRRRGLLHPRRACRWLALGAVQALGQGADRGLQRFPCGLQSRVPRSKLLLLPPPVVRLPREVALGRLRQDNRLVGKGRGPTLVPWGTCGGRPPLGEDAVHGRLYRRLCWTVPTFLQEVVGWPNIYP